jgi:hypothetical protein
MNYKTLIQFPVLTIKEKELYNSSKTYLEQQ